MSLTNSTQREAQSTKTTRAANQHERIDRDHAPAGSTRTVQQMASDLGISVREVLDATVPISTDAGDFYPENAAKSVWRLFTVGDYARKAPAARKV